MRAREERVLDIADIRPNPDQPRQVFDDEELEKLARSITATAGVLEAILVRPRDGWFEIVAGERRWRASQIAGLTQIRAVVDDIDDKAMALMALAENLVRKDLSVVEEAEYFIKLVASGLQWPEIGEALGLTEGQLTWKIQLVELRENCRPEVLHLVKVGHMTATMGWRLSRLSWNGQTRFLREINAKAMTAHEQMGVADTIWMQENQPDLPMFEETKLAPEEMDAAKAFQIMIDRAILLAERVEKMEQKKRGVLATALATELSVSIQKIGYLEKRLSSVKRSLQRQQGQMVIEKEGEAA